VASSPTVHVALSGGYYFRQINRLIGDLEPLFELDRRGEGAIVEVDLSRLSFIGPCGLVLLVAILHKLRARGLTLDGGYIRRPRAPGIATYLHRIDFYKRLFDEQDWPDVVEKSDVLGMRECRQFPSDADDEDWSTALREVTQGLLAAIEELVPTDDAAHTSLDIALSEMTENVGYHAATAFGGFAAVQYPRHSSEIEVAIADLGVGIAESLRRNDRYAALVSDDVIGIRIALTATVSSTPWRNSGYGLTFVQLLLALNEGRLLVHSGKGHVLRGANPSDRMVEHDLPGTLVGMRLRTDRPLDFQAAYEALDHAIETVRENHADRNHGQHEAG
jgi:hypothetical protein